MRHHFFFPIIALVLLASPSFAGQTMTMEQCIQKGLANNATLQAAQLKADEAGKEIKMARADFLPSLSSSLSANRISAISSKGPTDTDYLDQDIHSATVKLTQILYAGSRLVNTYDKAQLLKQANEAELELTRLELVYNIESTFYKVLKAKQDVIAATEAVSRLQENVKVAEAFFSKDLVPQVDVLSTKVDLADAENQLGVARNEENRQRMTLFSLMDLSMDPTVEFVATNTFAVGLRPSYEDCFSYALDHRPDLQRLEFQSKAASKSASIALGKYLPVVRLEGGYYDSERDYDTLGASTLSPYDRDQRNRYWMAGVTMTWDLFDGGRSWYENEKSELEARRFSVLRQEARNTISTGIRKALYSLDEAEQRLNGAEKALVAARENYAAEKNRLQAGVSAITELLDAQSRLVRAQVNKSNATLDYQLAQSELNYMTGGNFIGDQ